MSKQYPAPVSRILELGEPDERNWSRSLPEGITADHTDELIRLATDVELFDEGDAHDAAAWGPVHARRALPVLAGEAAVAAKLSLLSRVDDADDEWVQGEVPKVLARIGVASVPPLIAYIKDLTHPRWARIAAADALEIIAKQHADQRTTIADGAAEALKDFRRNPIEVNTFLINLLAECDAKQHAALVDQALSSGRTEEGVFDWDLIRVRLGLRQAFSNPKRQAWSKEKLGDAIGRALHPGMGSDPFDV
jgi:hypothetical protein